jgi:hypothetical protein
MYKFNFHDWFFDCMLDRFFYVCIPVVLIALSGCSTKILWICTISFWFFNVGIRRIERAVKDLKKA